MVHEAWSREQGAGRDGTEKGGGEGACCAGCISRIMYDTTCMDNSKSELHIQPSKRMRFPCQITPSSSPSPHLKDLITLSIASTRISACPSLNVSIGLNLTALAPDPPIFTPSPLARFKNSSR